MKPRIVLFVEGEGDYKAAPVLVSRILSYLEAHEDVYVDPEPFIVGDLPALESNDHWNFKRYLKSALKKPNCFGILILLDGDVPQRNQQFCAVQAAKRLANIACNEGGGSIFSMACVFACMEFESWFISAIDGFEDLPGNRELQLHKRKRPTNPETEPRNAKGWMNDVVSTGYNPTADQLVFTRKLKLQHLRDSRIRSYLRMENAVRELIQASISRRHFVSPT